MWLAIELTGSCLWLAGSFLTCNEKTLKGQVTIELEDQLGFFQPSLSQDARKSAADFLRRCLVLNPNARPTAAELLKDSWLTVVEDTQII